VNFYKRFVADIQIKTGHLTPAEFGVYDRLLDHYYATENALPEFERCCGIARAMTKTDREAVRRVLAEFFIETETGYSQRRADEMIAEALPAMEAARANGKKGGRPRTQQEPTGFSGETQDEPSAKASQNQNQILSPLRSERRPRKLVGWVAPDWVPPKEWADFETSRAAMRSVPFTDAARDGVVRELEKFRALGCDPAQLLSAAVTNGWRTVYAPRAAGGMVNKQEALEAANRAVGDEWLQEMRHAAK
jgi:uncharacterized protein YdaU (DUF1376 family)